MAAPEPAPQPTGYVTRAAFRRYQDGIEKAVAMFVAKQVAAALTRMTWRAEEAERRLAEMEARLATLEGRGDA
jgi:hypothetical protein